MSDEVLEKTNKAPDNYIIIQRSKKLPDRSTATGGEGSSTTRSSESVSPLKTALQVATLS